MTTPRAPSGATESGLPTITLHQFPLVWGRNVSPFCLKLEAWLRLAGVPYEVATHTNPARAPLGKLPYIGDGDTTVPDSSNAIEYLRQRHGIDPDSWLSRRQRAESLTLQRLFEDHLVFAVIYSRWIDPDGWSAVREAFFAPVPALVRPVVAAALRRKVKKTLHLQGLGRHGSEQIYAMARDDLEAAAALLGNKPFFMGEQPSTIDAVAYGVLANIFFVPVETELKRLGGHVPRLVQWSRTFEEGLVTA